MSPTGGNTWSWPCSTPGPSFAQRWSRNLAERLTAPFHPKLLAREDVVEEALHV